MVDKRQDFTLFAGETRTLRVTVLEQGTENPQNLTGATAYWEAKQYGSLYVSKSTDAGITIEDAENGLLVIFLSAEDTECLKGSYDHECQVVLSDSTKSTIFFGRMEVRTI